MHVLIDDVRDLEGMDIICRTASAGMRVCCFFGNDITHLYIDHDLGESKNGYEVIKTLLSAGFCPPYVQIVSSNPVGVKNIGAALLNAGYIMSLNKMEFTKCLS